MRHTFVAARVALQALSPEARARIDGRHHAILHVDGQAPCVRPRAERSRSCSRTAGSLPLPPEEKGRRSAKNVGRGVRPTKTATLAAAGITKQEASEAEALARIVDELEDEGRRGDLLVVLVAKDDAFLDIVRAPW